MAGENQVREIAAAGFAIEPHRMVGGLARPNVLTFGDWAWIDEPAEAQERELAGWLRS
jgi:hypothetical protein